MNKNTGSLWRDARHVIATIVLLLAATFALNYVVASNDLATSRLEALSAGVPAEKIDLPSATSAAVSRTFGALYGLVDLVNVLALVAVASLVAFYSLKTFYPNTLGQIGEGFDQGWDFMQPAEKTRWKIVAWIVVFFAIVHGRAKGDEPNSLAISEKARDTIIYYEVGGRDYFERYLTKPVVPAWQTTVSGVTVCFGVDVGHMTKAQIAAAFEGIASPSAILSLQSVAGMRGRNAYYNGLPKVKDLRFTWEQSVKIFERDTLPRFSKLTADAFNLTPNRLNPHENGALVSLVFNRGGALGVRGKDSPPDYFYPDSRKEMRQIRYDLGRGYAGYVPTHIRSMKRLWSYSSLKGLHLRRDAEAELFHLGSIVRLGS